MPGRQRVGAGISKAHRAGLSSSAMRIESPVNKWLLDRKSLGSSERCVPFSRSSGTQELCVFASLMNKMTMSSSDTQELREVPFCPVPSLPGFCVKHAPSKRTCASPTGFNLFGWNLQRLKLARLPRGGESYAVGFVWEPKSPHLPLLCSRHICMFGFSRRGKSHKQSTSGILQGVQLCPCPTRVKHMPHSPGCGEHCTHQPCLKSFLWKTHSCRELSLCNSSAF